MTLALTITLVVVAAFAAYLYADRRGLQRRHDVLACELADAERQVDSYKQQIAEQAEALAVARTRLEGMDEKFKAIAGDVLKQTNEQFLQLAKKTFEGEQKDASSQLDQRKVAIEGLVKPIREKLEQYERQIQTLEKERKQDKGSLQEMLASMAQDQQTLRSETANLVKALRRPEVRGRWGELTIDRVLELAGLSQHCHDSQVTSDDGTLRVDKVVHLPGDREIVIDVKTPMDAFLDALEATEDDQRETHFARHIRQIEDKVKELTTKRYQDHYHAADFIIMFIPGESFLQPAVARKPAIIEQAFEKGIVIATPSTLVALLKAVALGWREQQMAENASRISDLGIELHNRLATMVEHLGRLHSAIDNTVKHYNKLVGSLETNVMPQARRFKELGAAKDSKNLPAEGQLPTIEKQTREPKESASA